MNESFKIKFFRKKQQQSILLQNGGGHNHQIRQQKYLNGKITTNFHSLKKMQQMEVQQWTM
jgi:hypothetical protein